MSEIWTELTLPQADVLAAVFTMLAGVFAVITGGLIFGSKVASLQQAIKSTEQELERHIAKLETALTGVKQVVLEKVAEVEAITLATGARAAEESGRDIESPVAEGKELKPTDPKARLQSAWESIRAKLEATASDVSIHGRTRARYLQIDRRSYRALIDALTNDGRLSAVKAELISAVDLRNQTKRGKLEVKEEHALQMERLRDSILSGAPIT